MPLGLHWKQRSKLLAKHPKRRRRTQRNPFPKRKELSPVGKACVSALYGAVFVSLVSYGYLFSYSFLTTCDHFDVTEIDITGNHRISDREIKDMAQIHIGKNVLSLNMAKVRKRLMADPWIVEAEVSRELPDKMHIRIRENEPLAVLDLGRKFLINLDGEIFKEWRPKDPADLPLVTGLLFSDINVSGKPRSKIFNAVMELLHVGRDPSCVLGNDMIKVIEVDREMGLTVHAPGYEAGRIGAIKLGYNNYQGKYERLKNVVYYLKKNRFNEFFETIDLNNIDRIVLNPIETDFGAAHVAGKRSDL